MIKIYTKPNCPYCLKAKAFFDSKELKYELIDLSEGNNREIFLETIVKERPFIKTVPQIFINEEYIGGYTDLIEKYENKELDI